MGWKANLVLFLALAAVLYVLGYFASSEFEHGSNLLGSGLVGTVCVIFISMGALHHSKMGEVERSRIALEILYYWLAVAAASFGILFLFNGTLVSITTEEVASSAYGGIVIASLVWLFRLTMGKPTPRTSEAVCDLTPGAFGSSMGTSGRIIDGEYSVVDAFMQERLLHGQPKKVREKIIDG